MIRQENGIFYRRKNGVIYVDCGFGENKKTAFDETFKNLDNILSARVSRNYGSNTAHVRKNLSFCRNKLIELRTAIVIGKKLTNAVLQSIPKEFPLLFVTGRNETRELVVVIKENFETLWNLLLLQIQEWLRE